MANSLQVNANNAVAGLGTFSYTIDGVAGAKEATDITAAADVAGSLNSTFFNLYSAKDATHYYVWFDDGGGVDPLIPDATGIPVVYTDNDSANTIAGLVRTALTGNPDFVITGATSHIIVTNTATGATTNASNGTASPGFSYSVTTPGSTASPEFVNLSVDVQSTIPHDPGSQLYSDQISPDASALVIDIQKNSVSQLDVGGSPDDPTPSQPSIGCQKNVQCEAGDVISVVFSSANAIDARPNSVKSNVNLQVIESQ